MVYSRIPTVSLQRAIDLVKELDPEEQRYLAHLLLDLAYKHGEAETTQSPELIDLAGIAPNLLGGEDAQSWVSRTRCAGTESRETY